MKRVLVCTAMLALAGCEQRESPAPEAGTAAVSQVPEQDRKALYMLGVSLARQYADVQLTAEELPYVKAGMREQLFTDGQAAKPRVDKEALGQWRARRAAANAAVEKQKAQPFLEQAARQQGVVKTEAGALFLSLGEGLGPSPSPTDTVKVHYRALLADGTEFDSSYRQGTPHQVKLDEASPCWREGLLRMKVGGAAKLVCSSGLTFGDQGLDYKVPGGAATVFELELFELVREASTCVDC
ncbi:MAG TPA: FKBP-type peptidyl-prolyl cis-trans isomerase [Archangium sp.]|nr:FKBP-type peptidyl-prolyl cis-trans isomerase [Archangium sp.]